MSISLRAKIKTALDLHIGLRVLRGRLLEHGAIAFGNYLGLAGSLGWRLLFRHLLFGCLLFECMPAEHAFMT